jgi:hypothetical protein
MSIVWTSWLHYPDAFSGVPFDAPAGPGVFEVRHVLTGEQIAFAVSANVAQSVGLIVAPPVTGLRWIFTRRRPSFRSDDLEYRTCATASLDEARAVADQMLGRRHVYLQKRRASGW